MQYAQQPSAIQRREQLKQASGLLPRYAVCVVVALFVLIPIFTTVISSVKTTSEITGAPFALPTTLHWENYTQILVEGGFWLSILNSIIVTVSTVALLLLIACPPAFVFARMPFRGRDIIFNVMLFGLLFPFQMAILPLYVMLRNLHLVDTFLSVILPQVAFGLPVTILILRNFFKEIPQELEDATYIDGGSQIDFFWRILLPLARPSLAAVGMLSMVGSWNNFLLPLLVLNNQALYTLPLGIMQFQGEHSTDWALVMAFLTLSMIPAIVFYLFAERYLIAGLTAGAVKG
ncbi:MAG TPA: carbohydrate ABC transporter permease [Ktedonosporobacter sp.]|nr:carbohydrate ABC transporter permease [Ktedonosporobacter sp.]